MLEYVSMLNKGIYSTLALLTIFLLLRIFQKRKAATFKAGDIKLPVTTWLIIAPLLILITLVDDRLAAEIDRLRYEALIPPTDRTRLSVLIPDFGGEDGAGAADAVQAMLQSSLGAGVQILRIPALPPAQRYGDAGVQNDATMAQSLFCAARYNADVVIWGTNLPAAGQVRLTYTAKGGMCRLQSNCGVMPTRYPVGYSLSDSSSSASPMSRALSASVVRSLMLAVDVSGETARPQECLRESNVARTYTSKAEKLLRGDPQGLSPDTHEMAVSLTAMFHRELFKATGDLRNLDRAIALLEGEIAWRPDAIPRLGRALSSVTTDRLQRKSTKLQARVAVDRLDRLAAQIGGEGGLQVRRDAAALLELLYFQFKDNSVLPELRRRYGGLLAISTSDEREALHLNTRLFGIEANELVQAPGPARYHAAAVYRNPAYHIIDNLPPGQLGQIWIGDRCTLARADLELEQFRKDPYENTRTVNRITSLFTISELDWANQECTHAMRRLGEMYAQLHALGMDSPQATLLRTRVDIELEILRSDRTQGRSFNRGWLALALAELARASRDPKDRQHAVDVLKASIADAGREHDTPGVERFRRELASVLTNA